MSCSYLCDAHGSRKGALRDSSGCLRVVLRTPSSPFTSTFKCAILHALLNQHPRREIARSTELDKQRIGKREGWRKRRAEVSSSVGLCDALDLILLLDGVRVGAALVCVDELIRKAFSDGLEVAESGLAGTAGEKIDGLVHAAHGRDVHRLAANDTGAANACGIFAWSGVDDGIDDHLKRIFVGEQVNDLHGVLHDAHGHELLAVVAAVHHQGVHKPFDDGRLRLPEAFHSVAPSSVRQVLGELRLHGYVVLQRDVVYLQSNGSAATKLLSA